MTKYQKQEIKDAAHTYGLSSISRKSMIVQKVWFRYRGKGLRQLAEYVGDSPEHLAYIGHIGIIRKRMRKQRNRSRRQRKPLPTHRKVSGDEAHEIAVAACGMAVSRLF